MTYNYCLHVSLLFVDEQFFYILHPSPDIASIRFVFATLFALQSIFRPGEYSKHGLMCFVELCGNRLFRVVVHSRYRFGISCIDQRFSVLHGCIIVLLAIGV